MAKPNKKKTHFKLFYLKNSDAVLICWNAKKIREAAEYRIFMEAENGKYALFGSTTESFRVFAPDEIKGKLYVEARDAKGNAVAESQHIAVTELSEEYVNITAVKSYDGINIDWSEKSLAGRFIMMTKTGDGYALSSRPTVTNSAIVDPSRRTVIKIAEFDADGRPLRMSRDFEISPDCFEPYSPPSEIKLSVVIPVYNNQVFLSTCMTSVLSSTMKEIEIIVIDDGSSDKTAEIADWYADNYPGKVRTVHTPNQGAAMARNEGIKLARGGYITFVDSDDLISSAMYKTLYDSAVSLDCAIAASRYYMMVREDSGDYGLGTLFDLPCEENKAYGTDMLLDYTYAPNFESVSIINKIYKTSLVKEHPMPDLLYEDSAWSPVIYSYAESFCYSEQPFYFYNRLIARVKPTLSNEFAKLSPYDRSLQRIRSYNYILDAGNPEKRERLLTVSLRLVLRQLVEEDDLDEPSVKLFTDYLEIHRDEIMASSLIAADKHITGRLEMVREKYSVDLTR